MRRKNEIRPHPPYHSARRRSSPHPPPRRSRTSTATPNHGPARRYCDVSPGKAPPRGDSRTRQRPESHQSAPGPEESAIAEPLLRVGATVCQPISRKTRGLALRLVVLACRDSLPRRHRRSASSVRAAQWSIACSAHTSVVRRAVTRTATVLERIGRPSRSYISTCSLSRAWRCSSESRW